jgi:hypothetical protein
MLRNLPKIIVPVSSFTGTDMTLTGVITISGKTITGINTEFVTQITPGAELYVNNAMVGIVSRVKSDVLAYLEETADSYVGVATIRNFRASDVGKPITMSDILIRIHPTQKYLEKSAVLFPYIVVEGDTPEIVSYKFYKTPLYHWILLLINNITNPREEWPLSERQLIEKIALLYPDNSPTDVYEWRDTESKYVVDYDVDKAGLEEIYPVTIYEYETEKNEAKRNIKILDPIFLQSFITSYQSA